MITTDSKKTITMMELRSKPGTVLDNVFYRNDNFVVEKAGEPRAVIVSISDYEQLKKARVEARRRFMERTQEAQETFQALSQEEKQQLADEATTPAQLPQPR